MLDPLERQAAGAKSVETALYSQAMLGVGGLSKKAQPRAPFDPAKLGGPFSGSSISGIASGTESRQSQLK